MQYLVGGASTQSRARRPVPDGWEVAVVSRSAVGETWDILTPTGQRLFNVDVTWVFDQGGPVLGYTSRKNPWTTEIRQAELAARRDSLYGPGGIRTKLEVDAAALLCETVAPFLVDVPLQMRWFANGSDACDAAVRVSRAITGRVHFASTGYHGSSVLFAAPPQNAGVPLPVTLPRTDVPFGDSNALAHAFARHPLACYVVEVPSDDEDAQSFLQYARKLCDRNGAVLVLDEVVTGFRLDIGGAAQYYAVPPDLACYGKALSNGRGIAALVGNYEILGTLGTSAFYSNTYNGDPYNCSHVVGTLKTLLNQGEDIYTRLYDTGHHLKAELNREGLRCRGQVTRTYLDLHPGVRATILTKAVELGVLVDRPNYATAAHTQANVKRTVEILAEARYRTSTEGVTVSE